MRFGSFIAPLHPAGQDPTYALERDLDLIVELDRLGFDEVWVGEHHSGGFEIIPCPELVLAVAAERTRHIRLGTGVVSLPYHHPLTVAHRIALLDHLTRGRVMFGCGPGQLASDARMLGIPTDELRPRMVEALDVVVRLLNGETVSHASWFTLDEARLHLTPFSGQGLELAVTGTISVTGPRTAGSYGAGLLSLAATTPAGFGLLRAHWDEYEAAAQAHGHVADRAVWRCVGPVHLADTREQARRDIEHGIVAFARYFHHVIPGGMFSGTTVEEILRSNDEQRIAIIGTPDDAIERLQELDEQSGGFGTFLMMGHEWANPAATKRSLELFAQYVMPRFNGRADAAVRSWAWVDAGAENLAADNMAAIMKAGMPAFGASLAAGL
ncbi:LLM class flavin-dependent oxidoreductase [Mycobacterium terramassiliense]|uniref:Monooxygenase n=1 Tax=Mycobacterium terramassiliense TaxID=1841859 RepID=A0A2U3NGE1_9MYCO|nr:LLM class flavin-dependent oxidoreductase [Mycobacterium terramassiliense]SPM30560.1 monooxygenase [Mycobacterium terramassiliense]